MERAADTRQNELLNRYTVARRQRKLAQIEQGEPVPLGCELKSTRTARIPGVRERDGSI
jgi:hypothetical protein